MKKVTTLSLSVFSTFIIALGATQTSNANIIAKDISTNDPSHQNSTTKISSIKLTKKYVSFKIENARPTSNAITIFVKKSNKWKIHDIIFDKKTKVIFKKPLKPGTYKAQVENGMYSKSIIKRIK